MFPRIASGPRSDPGNLQATPAMVSREHQLTIVAVTVFLYKPYRGAFQAEPGPAWKAPPIARQDYSLPTVVLATTLTPLIVPSTERRTR